MKAIRTSIHNSLLGVGESFYLLLEEPEKVCGPDLSLNLAHTNSALSNSSPYNQEAFLLLTLSIGSHFQLTILWRFFPSSPTKIKMKQ